MTGAGPDPAAAAIAAATAAAAAAPPLRAVTLQVGDERFALGADMVQEIIDPPPVTRVPGAPAFAAGLANVRGAVVPVADFRVLFGMPARDADRDTRIVVVEIPCEEEAGGRLLAGLVADKVHEVVDLDPAGLAAPPRVGLRWPPEFIRGIARQGDAFVVLPDLGRIFSAQGALAAAPAANRGDPS